MAQNIHTNQSFYLTYILNIHVTVLLCIDKAIGCLHCIFDLLFNESVELEY